MLIKKLMDMNGASCACGRKHEFNSRIITGQGVITQLPDIVQTFQTKKVFLLADKNTYIAAGSRVCEIL